MNPESLDEGVDATRVQLWSGIIRYRKLRSLALAASLLGTPGLILLTPRLEGSARQILGLAFGAIACAGLMGLLVSVVMIYQYKEWLKELE